MPTFTTKDIGSWQSCKTIAGSKELPFPYDDDDDQTSILNEMLSWKGETNSAKEAKIRKNYDYLVLNQNNKKK